MYQAPIDDYDFLLRHVIDGSRHLDAITAGQVKLDDVREILSGAATYTRKSPCVSTSSRKESTNVRVSNCR